MTLRKLISEVSTMGVTWFPTVAVVDKYLRQLARALADNPGLKETIDRVLDYRNQAMHRELSHSGN